MSRTRGVALIAVTGLAGLVAGGWLDYNTLSDNDAVRALAAQFLAILVALVAGAVWSKSRGQRSKVVALTSATFFVAMLVGGWIAPTAHPVGWSSGSARVELRGALSRTETIDVDCRSQSDGALLDISNVSEVLVPGVTPDRLGISFGIQAESPLVGGPVPASTWLYLRVWTGEPGSGPQFEYNPEAHTTSISAEGTPEHGQLTFEKLPRLVNGNLGPPNDLPTLNGVIDWTCQPATKQPTPVEGSWFH